MRTWTWIITVIAGFLALPALAASPFTGTSYDVKIAYDDELDSKAGCVTFDSSGRFSIEGKRISMLWAQPADFPDEFLAVTSPLGGTGADYALGVHGRLLPDATLVARGIDEFGSAFVLNGTRVASCETVTRQRQASSGSTGESVNFGAEYGVATNPCATSFCDPEDLLKSQTPSADTASELTDFGAGHGVATNPCATSFCDPEDLLKSQTSSADTVSEPSDFGAEYGVATNPCSTSFCDPEQMMRGQSSSETAQEAVDFGIEQGGMNESDLIIICDLFRGVRGTTDIRAADLAILLGESGADSNDPCDGVARADTSTGKSSLSEDAQAEFGNGTEMDPCWMAPCDPAYDPLRDNNDSDLIGRSFQLTLGKGNQVIEYCWSFRSDGEIVTAYNTSMTWSATDAEGSAGFDSVGTGHHSQGMAYFGVLEGNLLRVTGIEARDGKAMVVQGWGQPVAACEMLW